MLLRPRVLRADSQYGMESGHEHIEADVTLVHCSVTPLRTGLRAHPRFRQRILLGERVSAI